MLAVTDNAATAIRDITAAQEVPPGAGLRIAADDVLAGMLRGLGARVARLRAPFEPEAGAYAAGHHSHSGEAKHAGVIHDFAMRRSDR